MENEQMWQQMLNQFLAKLTSGNFFSALNPKPKFLLYGDASAIFCF